MLQIGSLLVDPPVLSAPLAGYTNYAFRELLRFFGGVGLITTEMVSARSFHELEKRGAEHPLRLAGIREEARPLSVQIWDNDPGTLAEFAHRLAFDYKVSVIDLNFGCPARQIAGKSASGSYLLQDVDRLAEIVRTVVQSAHPVPVTAKIRLGWTKDTINAVDIAQAVEECGAGALTVHGRTAQEMYRGFANWEEIGKIRPHLKKMPIIGNGDIKTVEDALARLKCGIVDGIMIGRAALNRPWLFRQIAQALRNEPVENDPDLAQQRRILEHHYELVCRHFQPDLALLLMRKYACDYAQGKSGARIFRSRISTVKSREEFLQVVEECFPRF